MTSYGTTIEIDVPPDAVWAMASRPDTFPEWPSGVVAVTGADGVAQVGTIPDLQPSFDQFASGLRDRVEGEPRRSDEPPRCDA